MQQRVVVLGGSGNVGREFIKQVISKDSASKHLNPTNIVGVAGSKNFLFDDGKEIDRALLKEMSKSRESALKILNESIEFNDLRTLREMVTSAGLSGEVIYVDATAGKDDLLEFHHAVVRENLGRIVTANKNPVSLYSMDDFRKLTVHHGVYDFNTTVMGGAGAVDFLHETFEVDDKVDRIEGCFSGTLGFIMSELEKGEKVFSEIVKEAQLKGFTEPNPWDDLNGLDVARKLVILVRSAGKNVEFDDVIVKPLIDKKYAVLKGSAFLEALKAEDKQFDEMRIKAKERDEVLRYVAEASFDSGEIFMKVGLKSVPKFDDAGTLNGPQNLVKIYTAIHPSGHVIKSAGAGLAVTAQSLRKGILRMMPQGQKRSNY